MDRLGAMEAFIAVVDQGGFTDAAKKLNISKSAISKHVSALEKKLGVRLLNRTTRRVSPTEIGLAYYDRAVKVIEDASSANEMVSSMQSNPKGSLRISVPVDMGAGKFSVAVGNFLKKYPDVSINMTLDDHYVEMVSGNYDVAVRIGSSVDANLQSRLLAHTGVVFVASDEYLEENGYPENINDLSNHHLLHYSNLSTGNTWKVKSASGEERQIRAVGRLTINNGASLLSAAESGLGIARLPCFIVRDSIKAGKVREILPDLPEERMEIHAVYPQGKYTLPKLFTFIDYLSDYFEEQDNLD